MFRFLHAADLHLDTPFRDLSSLPPAFESELRDASLRAFDKLIDCAIDNDVAFCLFAGDIYDGATRGIRAQHRFRTGLNRLSDAGIRSFVVHGNHDPLHGRWSAVDEWPENVVVFESGTPQLIRFDAAGQRVVVQGVSYAEPHTTENLAASFVSDPDADFHVGLLHATVGESADHGVYAPANLDDLRNAGIDYWALGHIHTRAVLSRDPWVVYPGNLQGRSMKPSERAPKGAMLIEVDGGRVTSDEFVPLDVVRFAEVELAVDGTVELHHLVERVSALGAALDDEHDHRYVLARLVLTGRSELQDSLSSGSLDELLDTVREDSPPNVWWDRLTDRTLPLQDLEELATGDGFVAATLREIKQAGTGDDGFDGLRESLPKNVRASLVRSDDDDYSNNGQSDEADLVERAQVLVAELLVGGE